MTWISVRIYEGYKVNPHSRVCFLFKWYIPTTNHAPKKVVSIFFPIKTQYVGLCWLCDNCGQWPNLRNRRSCKITPLRHQAGSLSALIIIVRTEYAALSLKLKHHVYQVLWPLPVAQSIVLCITRFTVPGSRKFVMSSNNIDTHNGLPCRFIIIRNLLTLSSAILWSFTYILYVRQAFRDKSYGMPILALSDSRSTTRSAALT